MEEQNGLELERQTPQAQPPQPQPDDQTQPDDDTADQKADRAADQNNDQAGGAQGRTLVYRIAADDLFYFHLWMSAAQVQKNKKRMTIMGAVEIFFGGAYLISLLLKGGGQPATQYLLGFLLVGMGIYGITFYKFGFEKNLRRVVNRQHDKTPYFQQDITVDLYPNKCVEHVGGEPQPTYWKDISSVRADDRAFIISLESKRCVLIPKTALDAPTREWVDAFLADMCARFEKPRYDV